MEGPGSAYSVVHGLMAGGVASPNPSMTGFSKRSVESNWVAEHVHPLSPA
jgi:hypothetical protein